MNNYEITLRFQDVEFSVEDVKFLWSGDMHLDQDGAVVGLAVEWLGDGPKEIYMKVPLRHVPCTALIHRAARTCANTLERIYGRQIKDAVDEWHVSIAEKEFEYQGAAE